jgi:hypothetical protein
MDLEESERSRLDGMKADEKAAAEREVFAALSRFQPPLPSAKVSAPRVASAPLSSTPRVQAVADDDTDSDEEAEADVKAAAAAVPAVPTAAPPAARRGDIWAAPSRSSASVDEEEVYVPPPRAARKALIAFTPRAFPTPMRESTGREEDDWLAKNRFKVRPADIVYRLVPKFWTHQKIFYVFCDLSACTTH